MSLESQWTDISSNILSIWKYCQLFMHELNTFLFKNMPFKPMGMKNSRNLPFHLGHMDHHLIHPSLGRPCSPPQMASASNHPFCHSTLSGQTYTHIDTQTDRQSHAWYRFIPRALTLYYVDSEWYANNGVWCYAPLFQKLWQDSAAESFTLQHCCCFVAVHHLTVCLQWYVAILILLTNITYLTIFVVASLCA